MGRELPQRESGIFKSILRHYEHKQYKKGLKLSEQILKKFPEHGETLAMKGLFLSNLDKKEEGYQYVRKGLTKDLQSHICWHVYGLLHRADKNYEEAAKCYSHALKYDKQNQQILRDYSLLQMQMRQYEGLADTRLALLKSRSNFRIYWTGYAISLHLLKEYAAAESVLSLSESVMKRWNESVSQLSYEYSEMLLYKNMIIEESGDTERALSHLDEIEFKVCDKIALKERRAAFLMKLGRSEEAAALYESLIGENPNRVEYFRALQVAKGISTENRTPEEESLVLDLLQDIAQKHRHSAAARREALRFARGETFRRLLDSYFQKYIRKGSTSLFVNIKSLYSDSAKEAVIQELLESYLVALRKNSRFPGASGDELPEPPSAFLVTLYLLARHYDHKGETQRALQLLDEAIEHTPTFLELHMAKAAVFKHAGDVPSAAMWMDEARKLDLQDRFVNCKCVKYMLRAGRVADAEKTAALFTRADCLYPVEPLNDLIEMQAMWFEHESAAAHARLGQYALALKRYHQIESHYLTILDDQFDFHMYSLKKGTLRQYLDLLRFEDNLRVQTYFFEAAQGAVKTYLALFDAPHVDKLESSRISEAELKKARNKAKKAEARARKGAEKNQGKQDDSEPYAKIEDPLAEAQKFLVSLHRMGGHKVETHLLSFEVYFRQRRYALAMKALNAARSIDADHPEANRDVVRLYMQLRAEQCDAHPAVKLAVGEELNAILGNEPQALETFILSSTRKNRSAASLIAAARSLLCISETKRPEAVALLMSVLTGERNSKPSVAECETVLDCLLREAKAKEDAAAFRAKAAELYPYATAFRAAEPN